jgi:hypothetical protein
MSIATGDCLALGDLDGHVLDAFEEDPAPLLTIGGVRGDIH